MLRRLVLLVSLFALGCGGGITPPAAEPVTGTVTYKGKPAIGFKVTLHPQFDMGGIKYTPYGETNKAGQFTLNTGAAGNGAPRGEYVVTIEKLKGGSDPKTGLDIEVDELKGKYADPAKSEFKVEIKAGENTIGPFNLN